MQVDRIDRADVALLRRLGATAPDDRADQLGRAHVVQRRRGTDVTYLVARDDQGAPLGLLPVYLVPQPWEPMVDPSVILDPPAVLRGPSLCLAGVSAVQANHLTVAAALDERWASNVATALVERARVVAADAGCDDLLIPYLTATQVRWLGGHAAAARSVGASAKGVLHIAWSSFDDYLSSLPQRRRTSIRSERRRFVDSGIVVREVRLGDAAADLAPLLAQTEHRYGHVVEAEHVEFHLRLLALRDDADTVTLVADRGGPAACCIIVASGDRWLVEAWGCDYASVGRKDVYFNLVFYEPIIRATARSVSMLDMGVGSIRAKRWRGCAVEPLHSLLIGAAARRPDGSAIGGAATLAELPR